MSDRIAVMRDGRVEQIGSPKEIYEEPATAYVADFLGVSNLMSAHAEGGGNGRCTLRLGDFELCAAGGDTSATGSVKLTIRPERVRIEPHAVTGPNHVPGLVQRSVYLGSSTQVIVQLAHGDSVQAMVQNTGATTGLAQGTPVTVVLPESALRVLRDDAQTPAGR